MANFKAQVVVKTPKLSSDLTIFSITERFTKGNGKVKIDMAMEFRFGQMEQSMKEIGLIIKRMDKESFGMRMAMSLTESGRRIRHMDMGYIHMSMEQSTKVTGSKTCSMDKDERSGKTAVAMKDNTSKG